MKQNTSLLTRGIAEIIIKEDLKKELDSGKKLRVKLGIDPTAPDLHIGHTVVLRKLRQFQDAGHQAVLIIGDFTAMIGDPSGRAGSREPLTQKQVQKNLERFLDQAGKILNMPTLEVRHNSAWLADMRLPDILALHARFTLQQLSQREDFTKRIREESPVGLHELDYPLLQAYDSVIVKAHIELGGIDQKLNLLAGRHLMGKMNMTPQHIIMTPLLLGTDGTRKMSKSLNNSIGLNETPNEMFGKIMTIHDALMPRWFELLTDIAMPTDLSPREAKLLLAKMIVGMYHGTKAGDRATENFIAVFSQKKQPDEIPPLSISNTQCSIIELLLKAGIKSKNEARRLIRQNGVTFDAVPLTDTDAVIALKPNAILQIGKRKFFKIVIT